MKKYTDKELKEILRLHGLWLMDDTEGVRADLSWANLDRANLSWANLYRANLSWANLYRADLYRADLSWADLSWADLSWVNLYRANLSEANIRYCVGNGKEIKTIQTDLYHIAYTKDTMAIGCEQHSIEAWFSFSDETIDAMDEGRSLEWWEKWKPRLQDIITNG